MMDTARAKHELAALVEHVQLVSEAHRSKWQQARSRAWTLNMSAVLLSVASASCMGISLLHMHAESSQTSTLCGVAGMGFAGATGLLLCIGACMADPTATLGLGEVAGKHLGAHEVLEATLVGLRRIEGQPQTLVRCWEDVSPRPPVMLTADWLTAHLANFGKAHDAPTGVHWDLEA